MNSYERFRDPDDFQPGFWCGPNDGGIKRGDSAETGGEEAGPTDGAGPEDETELLHQADLDDLTVLDADDPSLGLTDIGDVPPEDWAADTGPTHSAEEKNRVAWDQLKSKPSHKG
jgi:hypothetical protein